MFPRRPDRQVPKIFDNDQLRVLCPPPAKKTPYDLVHTHDRIFEADLYTMHGIPHRLWVKEVRKKRHMSLSTWERNG